MEAQRIRVRQEILERARRYRGMNVVAGLLMGAAGGLAIFGVVYPPALMFAVIATMALTVRLAAGLHQRLDALLDLLDHDNNNSSPPAWSLYRHALGEVAGLVHVAAACDGDVVGEQLQRDDRE